jgi:hypothetical protein
MFLNKLFYYNNIFDFIKVMISEIFMEFMIFDKTIDFMMIGYFMKV